MEQLDLRRTHVVVAIKEENSDKDASGGGNGKEKCKNGSEHAQKSKFMLLR